MKKQSEAAIVKDAASDFYHKISQFKTYKNGFLSLFLSPAGFLLKKFDKSTDINYNTYVAKTGCIRR